MKKFLQIFIASTLLLGSSVPSFSAPKKEIQTELKPLVDFLTSKDVLLIKDLPLSYYIGNDQEIAEYFGEFVCNNLPKQSFCKVIDILYDNPFAILGKTTTPEDLEGTQAQIERTDMKYGADIYDAATWQIALALAAKNNLLDSTEAKRLIDKQTAWINNTKNKATGKGFNYGYNPKPDITKNQGYIEAADKAFTFRMLAPDFFNKDPFINSEKFINRVTPLTDQQLNDLSKTDPEKRSAEYFKYTTTWSDWKPITGENAWALLVGPLQAEALLNNGKVSADSQVLKQAMNSLYAFSAMQAGIGAFYYAPEGSLGNQGGIPRGEISIENNFSVLGGLQILEEILKNTDQTPAVKEALAQIDIMLNGGTTVNGYKTIGLLSFIRNGAFDTKRGLFYTHGVSKDPTKTNNWEPDTSDEAASRAVDVNTWGISALGADNIDKWFGENTAFNIWKNLKKGGGYYNNGILWGVGYTLLNSSTDKAMSTEWTAGAISALYSLKEKYKEDPTLSAQIQSDLSKMERGITNLRMDNYLNANFDDATNKSYFLTLPKEAGQAYLYASKRFAIPFGWNANTLPSTTSNAWVIMNKLQFNPFQYLGKLTGVDYKEPAKIDISGGDNPVIGDKLPKDVTVQFNAGDLGNDVRQLHLGYYINGNPTTATTLKNGLTSGSGQLKAGADIISITFEITDDEKNPQYYGACQVKPATLICKDADCTSVKTISATSGDHGKKPCNLVVE